MSYGKCQRCEALGQVESVGTLDGNTGTPVVLQLCSQCSKLYLHLNRQQRRSVAETLRQKPRQPKKKADNWTLQSIRERAKAKRKSILVKPETPNVAPEIQKSPIIAPQEKRSKGGLVLP